MSTIRLTQPHQLPVEEARQVLGRFESEVAKYGVSLVWNGLRAQLKGIGISGNAQVTPTDVTLTLELGMMAKAVGVDPVRLEASLAKRLRAAFGAETG